MWCWCAAVRSRSSGITVPRSRRVHCSRARAVRWTEAACRAGGARVPAQWHSVSSRRRRAKARARGRREGRGRAGGGQWPERAGRQAGAIARTRRGMARCGRACGSAVGPPATVSVFGFPLIALLSQRLLPVCHTPSATRHRGLQAETRTQEGTMSKVHRSLT
ncbi:hypothetical protein CALCODRAFT_255220 [Calocera cornea HHB12733]|uniref:Uncharacterized protein n=1 Tax=Calocera cornea HHB12733 TaxID=1353952 RepID=A0A165GNE8_9BASI|nr:hypothetical protein CALCODRAFT_255220 [Calocera cornea HHB12733]